MKKLQYIYIFLLAVVAAGCYKDEGNYDYKQLPEVVISGIQPKYTVYIADQFKIPVTIHVTAGQLTDVSYEWKVDGKVVWTEKDLDVKVNFPAKANLYSQFDVIDNTTGIRHITTFTIQVSSPYKNGWLILSDLGDRSQLDFMRNDNVLIEDIYYSSNNEHLSGGASALKEHFLPWSSNAGQIFVACAKAPGYSVELDGNSLMKMINTEKEFIDGAPADFLPQSMDAVMYWDYLISAGKLYTRENQSGMDAQYQEGAFPNFPVEGDYELLPWTMRGNLMFSNDVLAFDKKHCSYVLLREGMMSEFDYKNDATKAFKPTDMGKILLAGGATSVNTPTDGFLTILKDLNDGQVYVHQFKFSGWGAKKYTSTSETVFPDASAVKEDTKFAVCIGRKYVYFTSGNILYAYNYESNTLDPIRDFGRPVREIALCATNYERLGIAVQNIADARKSDFMVLDVSVVGRGKTIEGSVVEGKCGPVVDILYKIGDQGEVS